MPARPRRSTVDSLNVMTGAKSEFATLTRLLDDPSPTVHRALLAAFRDQGGEAICGLREIAGHRGDPLAKHASAMLRELGDRDHIGEFRRFITSGHGELEEGCLLMERILNPEADDADYADPLDAMYARTREIMPENASMRDACRVLNRVIFHEWGFRGDQNLFLSVDGSLISRVLRSRRGIPISLCIVYLLVARRLGLPLVPVGLPGRFMLGYRIAESHGFFIDCFDGGVFRSRAEVKLILLQNGLPATDDYLAPVNVMETLCRCCRNLASQLDAGGDPERAELFAGFVQAMENLPDDDA